MTATPPDERIVEALCRAAEHEHGLTDAVVRSHLRRLAPLASDVDSERLVAAAVARLDGLGPLEALLADDQVDEVLVNGDGEVWTEIAGRTRRAGRLDRADLNVVVERILAPLGRRLDRSSPVVDARLSDGSRVCAVIPPVAADGPCLAIRRFRDRALALSAFCGSDVAALIDELLARRCNVVVGGATSSGKTALLNTVLARSTPGERIVIIEDTAELLPHCDHLVRLEARPDTPDGVAAVTLEHLVRTAMRLRPDRLVVGEVRGSEVLGLVQALNTGHDGSWSTCHANGAVDVLHRLETLVLQAAPAWPLRAVRQHLARSIDVVVHVERTGAAARRITEVAEVIAEPNAAADSAITLRTLARSGRVVAAVTRGRR